MNKSRIYLIIALVCCVVSNGLLGLYLSKYSDPWSSKESEMLEFTTFVLNDAGTLRDFSSSYIMKQVTYKVWREEHINQFREHYHVERFVLRSFGVVLFIIAVTVLIIECYKS